MLVYDVPGKGAFSLENLVLDLNGTIALDGVLLPGVKQRIERLRDKLRIFLVTSDTFGTGAGIADDLGIQLTVVDQYRGGDDKLRFVRELGGRITAAIGNGTNDGPMFSEAELSIAILGSEGCAVKSMMQADILVKDICDALDLLLIEKRLVASLRP
ncbi:MAG: HAD family hydrolase [Acidobacteriota bacterium]